MAKTRVAVIHGDIMKEDVDAIVNASNIDLMAVARGARQGDNRPGARAPRAQSAHLPAGEKKRNFYIPIEKNRNYPYIIGVPAIASCRRIPTWVYTFHHHTTA
jgi:hypothetical protein